MTDAPPRMYRITELRCTNARTTLDALEQRIIGMRSRAGVTDQGALRLAVFGTIDLLTIDEVGDLKQLSVAPTYESVRFQRSQGGISTDPIVTCTPARPFVAVSYLKLNPLADFLVGGQLVDSLIRHIRETHRLPSQIFMGLDSAQVIVVHTLDDLCEFETVAWQMRGYNLGALNLDLDQLDLRVSTINNASPDQIRRIRVLSWSHSVVGMPIDYLDPNWANSDFRGEAEQKVILRTRHRLLPGSGSLPQGSASVLGHQDCVTEVRTQVNNERIRSELARLWNADPTSLTETEIEFSPRKSTGGDDSLTEAFRRHLSAQQVHVRDEFLRHARPHGREHMPDVRPYSPQRTNGCVNLLLAINQRFSDPFGLGQAWRLHDPLNLWLAALERRPSPQAPEMRKWAKYLEFAIRIDDEQEDPSHRPSLPLSFASRGGYAVLREAFVAYVVEVTRRRARHLCPLVVDSVETRLMTKFSLGMVVLVSGMQIQSYPLWPYMFHEIEHYLLNQHLRDVHGRFPLVGGELLPPVITEARCDYAMVYTDALGDGPIENRLESAANLVAWSLAGHLHETTCRDSASNVVKLALRLAYLHALAMKRPLADVDDIMGEPWGTRWLGRLARMTRIGKSAAWLRREAMKIAEYELQMISRAQKVLIPQASIESEVPYPSLEGELRSEFSNFKIPNPLTTIIGRCAATIPSWDTYGDDRNGLPLKPASSIFGLLEELRDPVWRTRRESLAAWHDRSERRGED